MAFFDNLTASVKQKWLPYYQQNRAWIRRQVEVDSVETPDGGRRPSSYLILGVISALEPELAELMLPFTKLNPNADALIDVLELNFDPEMDQNNNINSPKNPPVATMEGLTDSTNPPAATMEGLIDSADEIVVVAPDEETVIVIDATQDEINDLSLDAEEMMSEESKEEYPAKPSATHSDTADGFQWEQETNSEFEQAEYANSLEENKQGEKSANEEISRLFPSF